MKRIPPEKLVLFLLPLAVILVVVGGVSSQKAEKERQAMKLADNLNDAERCIELHSKPKPLTTARCNRVDSDLLPIEIKPEFAKALESNNTLEAKAKAEREKLAQAEREKKAAIVKKAAAEKAAADAKFKAEGWFQVATGIYGRWCTQTCNNSKVIGDSTYWLMEVWAKDRAAGDIYARINILSNGTVVGWTNDTAYLSLGQKGILTFSTYQKGATGAELTEFNARG